LSSPKFLKNFPVQDNFIRQKCRRDYIKPGVNKQIKNPNFSGRRSCDILRCFPPESKSTKIMPLTDAGPCPFISDKTKFNPSSERFFEQISFQIILKFSFKVILNQLLRTKNFISA